MDPDDEEASGNAIERPSFVYIIDVLYKQFSSNMKLYNGVSFQLFFACLAIDALLETIKN